MKAGRLQTLTALPQNKSQDTSTSTIAYLGAKENLQKPLTSIKLTGAPVREDEDTVLHWHYYLVANKLQQRPLTSVRE
ncbi:hypothetical protein PIIN_03145 [Serendipita indica DSM 11827]|uniref:Uncharacterized protein n=1 Tax=Serendipita indica (strain DSM 11827) TaxID=1109443 RepID=G4TD42_SERID|nr:hypothetical protein PIIN_03145 [Serendipita indica DSM 11827]